MKKQGFLDPGQFIRGRPNLRIFAVPLNGVEWRRDAGRENSPGGDNNLVNNSSLTPSGDFLSLTDNLLPARQAILKMQA